MTLYTRIHQLSAYRLSLVCAVLALSFIGTASAQTTSFMYQGKLNDNGNPASGQYDFEFKLFDTDTVGTGTQQGSTISVSNATVTAGIFNVQLDFGGTVFPGAPRFLEIAVKKTTVTTFTTLSPRQLIGASPYAIHTLNADGLSVACTNCVTSSQIQNIEGSKVTGSIAGSQISGTIPVASVPAGSSSYIQNTTSPQSLADFNITGSGSAGILNASLQYNLGGTRILSSPGQAAFLNNLYVGVNAGQSNPTGFNNSFFGQGAGAATTGGSSNSFFGTFAGQANTTGFANSFFGASAGVVNSTGGINSFFGVSAGQANTTGSSNVFLGSNAGTFNTTGGSNVFVGSGAGSTNTIGSNLTVLGKSANVGANNLNFATAIGAGAIVNTDNTVVLGRATDTVQIPGVLSILGMFSSNIVNANTQFNLNGSRVLSNAGPSNIFVGVGAGAVNTGSLNSFFGDSSGLNNTTGSGNAFFGFRAGMSNTTGASNSFFGAGAGSLTTGASNSFFGLNVGSANTTGNSNSFFGVGAGSASTTGSGNTFIGVGAGNPNTATQVNNSTAIGINAIVSTSNTIVLGTSTQRTQIPGLLNAGNGRLEVVDSAISGGVVANNLYIRQLNQTGSPAHLCFKVAPDGVPALLITTCTTSAAPSSLKNDLQPYSSGLEVISRLAPMIFTWTENGKRDLGLSADDVAQVEPLLVTRNDKGEVEDVKEGSLDVLFINAFKEQQKQIEQQRQEIEALKKLLCQSNPAADICKPK